MGLNPKGAEKIYPSEVLRGGFAGTALHKLIEDACPEEFPVAASSWPQGKRV